MNHDNDNDNDNDNDDDSSSIDDTCSEIISIFGDYNKIGRSKESKQEQHKELYK